MALAFIFIEFGGNRVRDGMRNIFEGTKENLWVLLWWFTGTFR